MGLGQARHRGTAIRGVAGAMFVLLGLVGASVGDLRSGLAAASTPCLIFLVPGAFGGSSGGASYFIRSVDYFAEYVKYFEGRGCRVRIGEFPPDGTIEERSLVLKDQLERFRRGTGPAPGPEVKVALIAHSQGGLDARFALRELKMPGVSALISIGVPHHGTPAAEWTVRTRDSGGLIYWLLKLLGDYDLRALRFAGELTSKFLKKHAAHFEAVPGVRYASARGICLTGCHASLRFTQWWLGPEMSMPGDGLVPGVCQIFGDDLGEYDLDHLSEVGTDPAKSLERLRFLERIRQYLAPW